MRREAGEERRFAAEAGYRLHRLQAALDGLAGQWVGGVGAWGPGDGPGSYLEVGDAAEALCLALGDEVAARLVQPRELQVLVRLDRHGGAQREARAGGRAEQRQRLVRERVVLGLDQRRAVDSDLTQLDGLGR